MIKKIIFGSFILIQSVLFISILTFTKYYIERQSDPAGYIVEEGEDAAIYMKALFQKDSIKYIKIAKDAIIRSKDIRDINVILDVATTCKIDKELYHVIQQELIPQYAYFASVPDTGSFWQYPKSPARHAYSKEGFMKLYHEVIRKQLNTGN